MKEIVVLSGKGGTGKTSIVASLAALAKSKVLADCDVDAADLYLLLQPQLKEENEFWSGQVAFIDREKCTECGLCQELCRFGAIENYIVDEISCEGCGFCYQVCPVDAITMRESMAGHWFISDTRYGTLVHARLGIAQKNSGKLVALVRQNAKLIAEKQNLDYIIINEDNSHQIERYCLSQGVEVAARIPFDNAVTEAMVHGLPVVEYTRNGASQQIEALWMLVTKSLAK